MVEITSNVVAVDTETTGVGWHDEAFLITAASRDLQGRLNSTYWRCDSVDDRAEATLALGSATLVFHNAKFDLQKLILAGIVHRDEVTADRIGDTEALAHLLNEHRPKRLKALAKDVLGLETDEADVLKAEKSKLKLTKDDGYDKLPREVVIPYALKDAEFTLALWEHLTPEIHRFPELVTLYRQELELTLVLLDMEAMGMALDLEYLEKTAKEYAGAALEKELTIREITGIDDPKFPNSPKQILEWFNERGINIKKTNKAVLKSLDHPLAQAILDLRSLRKIEGTYLRALLKEQRDGVVHPWIRQHGTVTGRAASGAYQGD